MLIGFVQGYEELKWGISKLNPLCNGPQGTLFHGVSCKTLFEIKIVTDLMQCGTFTSAQRITGTDSNL